MRGFRRMARDEGAEVAAVYLSVVSMVKFAGVSVWRFLGDFFEDAVTGSKTIQEYNKI